MNTPKSTPPDTIEARFLALERVHGKGFSDAPPPAGVKCDCDGDEHFHVRCMEAECDRCGITLRKDFFAYTKAEGFSMLFTHLREQGWDVDEDRNYCLCSDCNKVTAGGRS